MVNGQLLYLLSNDKYPSFNCWHQQLPETCGHIFSLQQNVEPILVREYQQQLNSTQHSLPANCKCKVWHKRAQLATVGQKSNITLFPKYCLISKILTM